MRVPSAVFCLAVLACAACTPRVDEVVLAAPVSLHQSGFTDFVVPEFEREFGVRVRVVATNDGFDLARSGDADVFIGHEPDGEQRLIEEGVVGFYRKVMFNRFLVVGPADDPAGVRGAGSAGEAFRRIAESGALYLSRDDGSPTYAREQQLWRLARVAPSAVIVTASDMASTLRAASERQAYTLTVRSVYERLKQDLALEPLFERDDAMLNTYGLGVRKDGPAEARRFAEWLAEGGGRPLVERFRIDGQAVFSVWPVTAPSKTPAAVPMDEP